MASWVLTKIGGASRTLEEWGISAPRLNLRNLAVDEFTFTIKRVSALAEPDFLPDDVLSLTLDGVQKFRGTITRAFGYGEPGEEGDSYTVSGPWFQLEQLIYQQPRSLASITSGAVTGYTSFNTSHVTLGQDQFGTKITTGAQIRAIGFYALTQGVPCLVATVPEFVTAPLDTARDITCAEAIKRCLMFTPDVVGWFDYSTSVPTLNIKAKSALSAVSFDLTAGTTIAGFRTAKRADLVPRGVVFHYVSIETAVAADVDPEEPDITGQFEKIVTDTAGLPEGLRVIVQTIELSRDKNGGYEPAPTGLAALYYALLIVPHYEGTLRLKGVEITSAIGLGKVLNLTNGRTAWASMNATVQTAAFDLFSGESEFECGPPEHLSPQDFVALHMANRKSAAPPPKGDFPKTQPDGSEGDPGGHSNNNAGISPRASATAGGLGSNGPVTVCS